MDTESLIDKNGNLVQKKPDSDGLELGRFSISPSPFSFSDETDRYVAVDADGTLQTSPGSSLEVGGTLKSKDIECEGIMKYDPVRNTIVFFNGENWQDLGMLNSLGAIPVRRNGN